MARDIELLPRSRLEYGLAGASEYSQRTNRQFVFGTANEYHTQVPETTNHRLVSTVAPTRSCLAQHH